MKLVWAEDAWDDYLTWQESDPDTVKKINALVKNIRRTPFKGLGKPEPLKGSLKGFWSRRIDREHRLVYRISKDDVEIIACRFHYGDR